MKKGYIVLAIAILLGVIFIAANASAAVCGDGSNGTVVCGNGNPEDVVNGYGVRNADVPHVQPGQSRMHADGFTVIECPKFFFNYCVDVTVTEVWKSQMRATAKQLQSNGWLPSFPKFAYWLTH